jgi:hypothetical protein
MKVGELFKPPTPKVKPPVPARCWPCAADLWREVAAGFARQGRIVSTLEIEEEVCRQMDAMTQRGPPEELF